MTSARKLIEGDPDPCIKTEGRAALFTLVLAVCAIVLCALAAAMCYGIYELIMWLMS